MKKINGRMLFLAACLMAAPPVLFAQSPDQGLTTSFGLRGGWAIPAGDWTQVRFAPEVNLFSPGFTIGGDLDIYLGKRISLGLDGAYQSLSGSDWESYAQSMGDNVSTKGSLGYIAILFRVYLAPDAPNYLRLELGPLLAFESGSQKVNGKTYTYDFFDGTSWGGEGALEYDRMISGSFALSLRVNAIILPSGLSYADGETRTLILVPVSAGIRTYF